MKKQWLWFTFSLIWFVQPVAYTQTPAIKTVTQYVAQSESSDPTKPIQYLLTIAGENLPSGVPQLIVFPAVDPPPTILNESPNSVTASYTASADYSVQQAVLSYTGGQLVVSPTQTPVSCNWKTDIKSSFQFIESGAAKTSYGAGVAKNFRVLQFSATNTCPLPVTIPLTSIRLDAKDACTHEKGLVKVTEELHSDSKISPAELSYITSFYNEDKQVTGRRALFFNSLAATAAIGSAIQPYFAKGFAQGVAILGGGFTTAAQTIYKDVSAQQLQALTSDSFGNSEQMAAHIGTIRKSLFIPRKIDDPNLACAIENGKLRITFSAIPTVTAGSVSTTAATP